ncbi:hypothetical protein F8388_002870 [Cannabis sativa]|uniref:Retrotransposon Copia-like N-terminal domain-containing protein n=2 Tax=Cannabis sativa TaxID=3483 RepID=A0A7J6FK20_CANSA|nr:hypothetical protein F8388_002870 [Cannabis sativa]
MSTGDSQTPQRGERHTGAEHLSSPQVTNGASQQGVHFGSGGFSNVSFGNTLTQPFSIKLDRNNYTLWRNLVSTIIRGHRLEGYVNGTKPCPTEFVGAPGNGENTPADSNHSQQSQATSPCDMPRSSHTDQNFDFLAIYDDCCGRVSELDKFLGTNGSRDNLDSSFAGVDDLFVVADGLIVYWCGRSLEKMPRLGEAVIAVEFTEVKINGFKKVVIESDSVLGVKGFQVGSIPFEWGSFLFFMDCINCFKDYEFVTVVSILRLSNLVVNFLSRWAREEKLMSLRCLREVAPVNIYLIFALE